MKLIVIFSILVFSLIFTGYIMSSKHEDYYPSQGEELVNSILGKTAKIIKEKYNIKPCGSGAAMPGGPIRGLTLCFDTKHPYTKEQLRELLIKSAQELLKQVNENNQIQKFIKDQPFTIKNTEIIIYNHDKNGRGLRDPEISTARISQGILIFKTIDKDDDFKFKNRFEESYEDALKIVQDQEHNQSN